MLASKTIVVIDFGKSLPRPRQQKPLTAYPVFAAATTYTFLIDRD